MCAYKHVGPTFVLRDEAESFGVVEPFDRSGAHYCCDFVVWRGRLWGFDAVWRRERGREKEKGGGGGKVGIDVALMWGGQDMVERLFFGFRVLVVCVWMG